MLGVRLVARNVVGFMCGKTRPFTCLVIFPFKEDTVIAVNESKIVLQPMQWGSLKDIDEVQKIGDSDKDCLE